MRAGEIIKERGEILPWQKNRRDSGSCAASLGGTKHNANAY